MDKTKTMSNMDFLIGAIYFGVYLSGTLQMQMYKTI
jgi:hypothetical protein